MNRAISLLLMVVMVLAPCAVAHAASLSSHHGSWTVASAAMPSSQTHAASTESHDPHEICAASHHPGEDDCSGNCERLQRVTETAAAERSAAYMLVSFASLVVAANSIRDTRNNLADTFVRRGSVELSSDRTTVLRKTARLRL